MRAMADRLGLTVSKISRSLKLLELPPEILDRVRRREISAATAYELTKSDDPQAMAERVLDQGLTRDEAAREVRGLPAGWPDEPPPASPGETPTSERREDLPGQMALPGGGFSTMTFDRKDGLKVTVKIPTLVELVEPDVAAALEWALAKARGQVSD
jgi:ParB family chromosome partitioning protein